MKKIFISHSSIDKEIVDVFIDKILRLGLNIDTKDIACTSREDTGVKTGDDIRNYIKENISNCDFVFFMISENYQNSQICLNEMGAAWATDRLVMPLIFPNLGFDNIGWLYNVRKGIKLNDSSALDTLFEDVCEKYDCRLKISTWNKQKDDFITYVNSFVDNKNLPVLIEKNIDEIEFDILDYREVFDSNMALYCESLGRMTVAQNNFTELNNKGVKILSNINNNTHSPSSSLIRPTLLKLAMGNETLIDSFEKEFLILESSFHKAIESGIKLREIAPMDDINIEEERESIEGLVKAMEEGLTITIEQKQILESDTLNLDKTYTSSKKKLIKCLSKLIEIFENNINSANELLVHT